MAQVVGNLTIEMAANVARLQKDMQHATSVVDGAMAKIRGAIKLAAGAFLALGAGLSVTALTGFVRSAINAADEMSKLSQKTGVAVRDLAGLQLAYRQAGVSAQGLETSLARMSRTMSDGNTVFAKMGISVKDASGALRPVREVLGEVADKFARYKDGAQKAAIAQEIFGRSGVELVPLLNAGSAALAEMDENARRLGLTMSEQAAQSAEHFNDTLDLMGQGVQGIGRQIAGDLLPTLNALAGEFLNSMTEGDRLNTIASALSGTFRVLYITGLGLIEVFSTVGKTVGDAIAAIMEALKGNFSIAGSIMKDLSTELTTDWTNTIASMDRAWNKTGDASVSAMAKVVASTKVAPPSIEKVTSATKKLRDEFDALFNKLSANDAGLDASFTKDLLTLNAGYQQGRITVDQYRSAVEKLLGKQEFAKRIQADLITQAKQANALAGEAIDLDEKKREQVEGQIRSAREMVEQIEFEARALKMTNTEREIATRLRELERQGVVAGTLAYEEYSQKLREAISGKAALEESLKLQEDAKVEWARTWDQVAQSFTDALMQGGKSVKDYLLGLFRSMVLRPIIQPMMAGALGAIGIGASGSAMAGGTNLLSAASGASSIFRLLGNGAAAGIGTGVGALGGDAIMGMLGAKSGVIGAAQMGSTSALAGGAIASVGAAFAGEALNKFISSGYRISKGADTLETGATVIAAAINPLAGVVVGAVSGVVNALFGRKLKDSGIEGTFSSEGFAGQQYEYYKGGLFRSNKTKRRDLDPDLQEALSGQFAALQYATAGMADALGASSDSIFAYTDSIKVSLKGLKEDEAQAKIAAEFERMGESMAALVPRLAEFAHKGETSVETLTRMSTALVTVNQAFDTLGLTMLQGMQGGDFASRLLDSMGGADAFGQAAAQYFEGFYTEAERVSTVTRQLTESLGGLGLALPESRDGFRALVESAREAGDPQMLAALLKLAPAFATIATSTDELAQHAQQSAQQLEQAAIQAAQAVASQRAGLERQLLEAMDDKAGLRALDLSALDASNRALQERIWAIQDARAAEADAAQRVAAQMQAAAAQMQAVAQQRYQIETRLLTLQGDTNTLRERELTQLDPSNRALQEQVWALEDQQAAAQAAAQAMAAASRRTAQLRDEWSRLTESVFDEVRRIRGELYGSGDIGYSQAQQQFAIASVQAKAGDQEALKSLPGLSRQMLDLAESNATSLLELQRMRAYTAGALLDTGNTVATRRGVATFSTTPPSSRTSSDPDLLAAIAEMRAELARIAETNEKSAPYIERTARILDDAQRGKAPLSTEAAP